MRQVHLRDVDLNLLHALRALLAERHVTRAAKRCFLSQSAMSRALERLRHMFGDPLLVRSGRAYERTVRGERVLRELGSLMPRLEALVRGEEFDPARSQERYRVAMTDHAAMVLMPPLMERIRSGAANVTVEAAAWNDRVYGDVAAGRIDTALSAEAPPPVLETEVLYEEDFVCLVGRAQRIGTRRFTLKEYLDLPHAIVETWEGQQAPVDRPLAERGLRRRAVLRIPFFVPTIFTVARTDVILTVPRRLGKIAVATADVRIVEPPHEIKGFLYFMAWHPRLTREAEHAWFRDQLRMAAGSIRTK
ncbi:MAG: LysR family transcriptional regulator [Candidatus Rokuibacteriota bacterium]|nr:MAG: LysR family transcriptional regulator [Candidatus Rokubacteria bacterium]